MKELDESITVTLRVDPKKTVGDLKLALAHDVINNLYFGDQRLENNEVPLKDIGILPGASISNSPMHRSGEELLPEPPAESRIVPMESLFRGPLSANQFVLLVYNILSMLHLPKIKKDMNESLKIFCSPVRPALVKILNQLDPVSFVRFGSTCKRALNFTRCRNSGIRVNFPCSLVSTIRGLRLKWFKEDEGKRTISKTMIKNLQLYPFVFKIDLYFRFFRDEYLEQVTGFVANLTSSIVKVTLDEGTAEILVRTQSSISLPSWSLIATFVNNCNVEEVEYTGWMYPAAFCIMAATKIRKLSCYGQIPDDIFPLIPLREVEILNSRLKTSDIVKLFKCVSHGILEYITDWHLFDYIEQGIYQNEGWTRCFDGCTAIDFSLEGPLPDVRPLVCHVNDEYTIVLTVKNTLFDFVLSQNCLSVSKATSRDDMPVAFQAYLQ